MQPYKQANLFLLVKTFVQTKEKTLLDDKTSSEPAIWIAEDAQIRRPHEFKDHEITVGKVR